ncbi:MAG: alpha/beta hydrolase-fold protein, partial [Thermoguttaceae bacterium]
MSHRRQSLEFFRQSPAQSTFEIQSGLFTTSAHDTVHAMFVPLEYEPGYGYPLIVWLHGPGSDERQLLRIMPQVSIQNFVAVAPRGTLLKSDVAGRREVYGWCHSDELLQQAQQRIFDSIELAGRRYHVNPDRIFLAGFDSGGTMAFRIGLNHPDRFAGIVSLGGAFPTGRNPLARLTETRQMPVFLAAGRRSSTYGENDACADLRLLHTAGLSITLRLYPHGHELTPQMLGDVNRWVMDRI